MGMASKSGHGSRGTHSGVKSGNGFASSTESTSNFVAAGGINANNVATVEVAKAKATDPR